jgi:hypothetical protein
MPRGRDLRAPGPERRGQDDDAADPGRRSWRPRAARARSTASTCGRSARGAPAHRLPLGHDRPVPALTARETLRYFGRLHGSSRASSRPRIDELVAASTCAFADGRCEGSRPASAARLDRARRAARAAGADPRRADDGSRRAGQLGDDRVHRVGARVRHVRPVQHARPVRSRSACATASACFTTALLAAGTLESCSRARARLARGRVPRDRAAAGGVARG